MYSVFYTKRAAKSLRKIPVDYQTKIKNIVSSLSIDPFGLDVKKLSSPNKTSHRLRVGSYRIFLDIDTTLKEVIIVDIERRTSQTYQ